MQNELRELIRRMQSFAEKLDNRYFFIKEDIHDWTLELEKISEISEKVSEDRYATLRDLMPEAADVKAWVETINNVAVHIELVAGEMDEQYEKHSEKWKDSDKGAELFEQFGQLRSDEEELRKITKTLLQIAGEL